MPKISVIIPIYNVEPYLARCLDSVCGQTLKDIEIICINDCSPDNSLRILQEYAEKDKRIKIIDFKENKNVAVARNAGLKEAKGEYLAFVDSDDYIDLDFYERLYNKAVEDNADIVKSDVKVYNLNEKIDISKLNLAIKQRGKYFFTEEWWSAIYKASMISDNNIVFPEECPKSQDSVFLNRCILKVNKLSLVNDTFYHYIRRESSLDAQELSVDYVRSALQAHKLVLDDLNKSSLANNNKEIYIQRYLDNLYAFSAVLSRNDEHKVKQICAEYLINSFSLCKNILLLEKEFKYSFLLPLIRKADYSGLTQEFIHFNSEQKLFLKQLRENTKRGKNA